MRGFDSVLQTQHYFDQQVNECAIQAIFVSEEDKTLVLLMHLTEIRRAFMDSYVTQSHDLDVSITLRSMKALKERWNSRNEREYGEANYVGRGGEGGSGGGYEPKTTSLPRQLSGSESRICYCCGKPKHFARECLMRERTCNSCKVKGHLENMCRMKRLKKL